MKNKANRITLVFIIVSILLAIASGFVIQIITDPDDVVLFHLSSYLLFIIISGLTFRYLIFENLKASINLIKRQKLINDEIKESKERYDIVAKATSDTVWDWSVTTNIFTWNRGIQNVFGYEEDDIEETSQWWFDRIHPEDSIRMSVKLYSFLEQRSEKWQDEYRFKCKDGTYKYILDRGFLVTDNNNEALRMIGAMQDITKKKQEEERLKLLETVITNAKDAVVITDADISQKVVPNVVFANQAYTAMSGYNHDEIINKSMLDTLFIEKNSDAYLQLISSLENKQECEIETATYRKNSDKYWVKFIMVPVFNKEKEHTHWISIKRDITEQKQQEREKEQLIAELTQNNKDLRQFSYITSHNLRAPLSNLIGLLNLTNDLKIEDEELQLIIDGFSKSTKLLNETVLDLGKVVIIRDNPSIGKTEVNVFESITNVLSQINILIEQNDPELEINIDKNAKIYSHKAYLESILLNLLTNSLKYRSLERRAKISVELLDKKDGIELIFEDNGIGIDLNKYKDKLFGLYQRFHNYPDSKGLGLYLVKSQIESMGGTIEIESEVNKGTRFKINFKKIEE
ncbi:sensor histidine kinase [Flavobacterium sp. SM2513]|uniref:sensor histidine kinase n=1 Tax=Flavobacterium sp. SM2513 TaxID=3424766 RepID=UPI003D7F5BD3